MFGGKEKGENKKVKKIMILQNERKQKIKKTFILPNKCTTDSRYCTYL